MPEIAPDWELFDRRCVRRARRATIILTARDSSAHISAGARELLGNPARVIWLYTCDNTHIGLRAADEPGRGMALSRNGTVAWRSLLTDRGIRIPPGTKLPGEWNAAKGILAFALPKAAVGEGGATEASDDVSPRQLGAPYSEEEIERIRGLLEMGRRPKFIGAAIGRSEASVYQKINGTPDLFALYNPEKAAKEKAVRDLTTPTEGAA